MDMSMDTTYTVLVGVYIGVIKGLDESGSSDRSTLVALSS